MKPFFRKQIDFIKTHPRIDVLVLLVGLGVFTAICIGNLTNASIWFDEAFSAYLIQFSFWEIAQFTAADVHPPLYYWILKVWEMLFGSSEAALRSLSVLFGAAAISLAFLLARRLFGRFAAGVSLLFLVLSPMLIRYSDEARMYTLAATIVMAATYFLLRATESRKWPHWVIYGVLVSLGMWTHYFTALAWLAHWVWRAVVIRRSATKAGKFWTMFLSKQWVIAHVIAIGLFLPWLPLMAKQLGGIQDSGFWIGPVGVDSLTNFFTNAFYYLEHGQAQGWLAAGLIFVLGALIVLTMKTYRGLRRPGRRHYLLVAALAFVPVILLILASLPPLKPSYVERYLIPATVAFSLFMGVTVAIGTKAWRPVLRIGMIGVITVMLIVGITNVYHYGNYNKNSNQHILTRELIEEVTAKAEPGEPIVAHSPWMFYEAVFYATDDHPVYFIDQNTDYIYGSLDMLKLRDQHKIKDLAAFARDHETIWYIGSAESSPLPPFDDEWRPLQDVSVYDPINDNTRYRGTQYRLAD